MRGYQELSGQVSAAESTPRERVPRSRAQPESNSQKRLLATNCARGTRGISAAHGLEARKEITQSARHCTWTVALTCLDDHITRDASSHIWAAPPASALSGFGAVLPEFCQHRVRTRVIDAQRRLEPRDPCLAHPRQRHVDEFQPDEAVDVPVAAMHWMARPQDVAEAGVVGHEPDPTDRAYPTVAGQDDDVVLHEPTDLGAMTAVRPPERRGAFRMKAFERGPLLGRQRA